MSLFRTRQRDSLRLIVLLVSLLSTGMLCGETTPELYKRWHDVCLAGDTRQIDGQIGMYEARLARDSKDQLARAYLGSACALRAKHSFWGPTKLQFLKRGRALLDAAVLSAPDDARVRMVRAIGYYKVPRRFGVRPVAINDFKRLVPVAKRPGGKLTTRECQAVLYYAFLTYSEEGEPGAEELKTSCHRLDPASDYGKLTK
jgi:hypothetical protein